jgi:hypothetical protein
MNLEILDPSCTFQSALLLVAFITFCVFWRKERKIKNKVELYASQLLVDNRNSQGNTISRIPYIAVQNVGSYFVYLDKYIVNGKEYDTSSQVLPAAHLGILENFYKIEVPTNNETYISIEIIYHDIEKYFWSSKIIATKSGTFGWDIKTLPKTPAKPLF